MLGLTDEPQRLPRPANIPRAHRQHPQDTRTHQRYDLGEYLLEALVARLDQIEGPIGHPGADIVGVSDVGLAHLDKPATPWQQPQRGIHKFPRQRVEHHIHPTTPGGSQESLLEFQRP